jgi:hypothetical protein
MEATIKLKDLQDLFKNKNSYKQNTVKGHTGVTGGYDGGTQGEYNEYFIFYKHPGLPEGIFMRETYTTDSYGDNDTCILVEFVEGKEKTITVYEPI